MRYFLTTNAQAPVKAPGLSLFFEPINLMGGSWLGVLAVDDESTANILAAAARSDLEEINQQQYDFQKKKVTATTSVLPELTRHQPKPNLAHVLADPVGIPTRPTSDKPNSTEMVTAVTLLSTDRRPPSEIILEGGTGRKSRW